MNLRFYVLLLLFAALAPLRAQEDQPVHMRPEFPLTFPLINSGRDVTVKYPVMINQTSEVKPGAELRTLYMLSRDSQDATDLAVAHEGSMDQSYARNAGGTADSGRVSPELAHEIEGYRRTIWDGPNNFILFLAQYPTESTHLIYSPTNSSRDLHDEIFHFFDGLFVGSPNGKVTVLAVEKQSATEKAGIKAGDEIIAIGAYPTHDDLMTFSSGYSAAKKDAKDGEASSYAVTLRGADGATRTAKVGMPTSIHGGLMDGFSEKP